MQSPVILGVFALLSSVWFCGMTVKVLKALKLLVLQDR